ncbi:16S rRNA processing protein RimM [bacterium D16-34]|nr:16S rRNA processing protein RimM [bacterium D16-34]
MRTWAQVAYLVKPKHLAGGLIVRATMGLPFLLSEDMIVHFVPPELDAPRQARVCDVQELGDGSYFVMFEGIDSIDVAERLSGCFCLVRVDDIEQELIRYDEESLSGYSVYDHNGVLLGSVVELEALPAQSRLHVKRPDESVILIPWVEEYVVDINPDKSRIDVQLPAGFLDLF